MPAGAASTAVLIFLSPLSTLTWPSASTSMITLSPSCAPGAGGCHKPDFLRLCADSSFQLHAIAWTRVSRQPKVKKRLYLRLNAHPDVAIIAITHALTHTVFRGTHDDIYTYQQYPYIITRLEVMLERALMSPASMRSAMLSSSRRMMALTYTSQAHISCKEGKG